MCPIDPFIAFSDVKMEQTFVISVNTSSSPKKKGGAGGGRGFKSKALIFFFVIVHTFLSD